MLYMARTILKMRLLGEKLASTATVQRGLRGKQFDREKEGKEAHVDAWYWVAVEVEEVGDKAIVLPNEKSKG